MTPVQKQNADVIQTLEGFIAQKPNFEGLLSIFSKIEKYIHHAGRGQWKDVVQNWKILRELRRLLVIVAKQLLLKDVIRAESTNIDTRLWTSGFYDLLSYLRSKAKPSSAEYKTVREALREIFKHGVEAFSGIVRDYESLGTENGKDDSPKSAAVTSSKYKVYTYLGDLHRYEAGFEAPKRHGQEALKYYELAAELLPGRYRAYHNAAIVHKKSKDILAAIFNFVRASTLEGGESSRLELLALFDDNAKTYQKQRGELWFVKSRACQRVEGRRSRKTVWMSTDTSYEELSKLTSELEIPQCREDHVQQVDDIELFRRFSMSFAYFVGILYTKIEVDALEEVAENCLVYLDEAFRRNVNFLGSIRIIHINALLQHMISYVDIKYASEKRPPSANSSPRRGIGTCATSNTNGVSDAQHMSIVAINFGLEIFGMMSSYLNSIIRLCNWGNPCLIPLSVGLQLWETWFRENPYLWCYGSRFRPAFALSRLLLPKSDNCADTTDDVWANFAALATNVEVIVFEFSYLFPKCKSHSNTKYSRKIGILPEYKILGGFSIHATSANSQAEYFTEPNSEMSLAFLFVRLVRLCDFAEQLCQKHKMLEAEVGFGGANHYKSVTRAVQSDRDLDSCGLPENDYKLVMRRTKDRLEALSDKPKAQKIKRGDCNNARVILQTKGYATDDSQPSIKRMTNYELWVLMAEYGFTTELIVCPKRVVLDTNCLIKDLEILDEILPHLRYPLLLPIAVVLELRGLSRGGFTTKQKKLYTSSKDPEAEEVLARNAVVAARCKQILQYFEHHWSSFQVVTSTGSFIYPKSPFDHIQDTYFNSEESNDERILDSCKYMEYHDRRIRQLDSPHRIFRNTILLTGDLILSARTITLDIPTKGISSFVQWFTSNHDVSVAKRFLWGVRFNPKEEFGLGYLIERYTSKSISDKNRLLLQNISAARKSRSKQRAQKFRSVIELNPQLFKL